MNRMQIFTVNFCFIKKPSGICHKNFEIFLSKSHVEKNILKIYNMYTNCILFGGRIYRSKLMKNGNG